MDFRASFASYCSCTVHDTCSKEIKKQWTAIVSNSLQFRVSLFCKRVQSIRPVLPEWRRAISCHWETHSLLQDGSVWCWLCMVEANSCFPKITKFHIHQYGIPGPQKGWSNTKDFQAAAPTVEESFIKPVNAGRKLCHQQRVQSTKWTRCYFGTL